MIEPAVFLVGVEGAAANDVLLCIATRIENVAEPSGFAARIVSTWAIVGGFAAARHTPCCRSCEMI